MKKFFEVKNITQTSADIYIYGAICLEKDVNFWTGETIESDTDVYLMDFKKALDEIGNVSLINLYVNSPGGDVFVTSTIISMLRRIKDKGTKIEVFVDALAASAASFLIMIADNIHIYKNSMIMVHKPMTFGYGNSTDLQKIIDELEQVENSTMVPMYMNKAKEGVTEEEIKDLIANESWLGAKEIEKYFDVVLEEDTKSVAAYINEKIFANYKHVPKELLKANIDEEKPEEEQQEETQPENKEVQEENKTEEINNNVEKEAIIRNKLNLVKASLFIKQKNNKEKEGI